MTPEPSGAHLIIDTRGTFCPVPIMKTSEAVRNLEPGGVVEVISDDPAIEHDMPAWCRSMGHSIVEWKNQNGVYHYLVRKRQGS